MFSLHSERIHSFLKSLKQALIDRLEEALSKAAWPETTDAQPGSSKEDALAQPGSSTEEAKAQPGSSNQETKAQPGSSSEETQSDNSDDEKPCDSDSSDNEEPQPDSSDMHPTSNNVQYVLAKYVEEKGAMHQAVQAWQSFAWQASLSLSELLEQRNEADETWQGYSCLR